MNNKENNVEKDITEEDTKRLFITPSLYNSGWKDFMRMEYFFTDGKITVFNKNVKRENGKKADYLLFYKNKNLPLAVVEAKKYSLSANSGIQQAINYARMLNVPFAYSTNGKFFIEHNFLTGEEKNISLNDFPKPENLWNRYIKFNSFNINNESLLNQPYFWRMGSKTPRYYQMNAINKTIEAIAKGYKRILLVMATGTGKTYTAFQIIHRLLQSKIKRRVLYLADRNILIDQTMQQDFRPFQKIMTKISSKKLDTSYQVYLGLYQQLCGSDENEEIYKFFDPNFFDLIIVDECHRGSAREDSKWRVILEYFKNSVQIGLTATPKETINVSTTEYFGEPVYTYSLKQGINDGFLAPYNVIREIINVDIEGYIPKKNEIDNYGNLIENKEYTVDDFDKKLVIDERTKLVAKEITNLLRSTDRFSKTIVFCVDIEHAERMRIALINENTDLVKCDSRYVMKITGDDLEGKKQLDNFIDSRSKYSVIVTTSKLLTTGVDCKTCKFIVLDTNINSMTEFKQIIGRGTRLCPNYGKYFFTILDFKGSTRTFFDPNFDGKPISIKEINLSKPKKLENNQKFEKLKNNSQDKYYVNVENVQLLSKVKQNLDSDLNLTTTSFIELSRKNILEQYTTLNDFLTIWNQNDRKTAIIDELNKKGVDLEELKKCIKYKNIDDFDLIRFIAYDIKPITKNDRINKPKVKEFINKQVGLARKILYELLDKYNDLGIKDLESLEILDNYPFREIGNPMFIVSQFGGKKQYENTIRQLEQLLYND